MECNIEGGAPIALMYSAVKSKLSNYGKKNTHLTPPKKKRKKN
jgi:hypothetical protein